MPPTDPAHEAPSERVRVPASTSNLGPGFDQLGLALELWLDVERLGPADGATHRLEELTGTATDWPRDDNRLFVGYDAGLAHYGLPPEAQAFRVASEIPLRRGLGSSGAAVAAGLHLAARRAGVHAPDLTALAALGTRIEGHPDNVVASLFGGCTSGVPVDDGRLHVVSQGLDARLRFAVAWPSTPLDTDEARAALPRTLSLTDAVWTTRRLTLLLEGLRTSDAALLRDAGEDRLHTPHRLPLIDGAREALAAAYEAGAWLAAISGSGSALVALHGVEAEPGTPATDDSTTARIAEAMRAALAARHPQAWSRVLRADLRGAHAPA